MNKNFDTKKIDVQVDDKVACYRGVPAGHVEFLGFATVLFMDKNDNIELDNGWKFQSNGIEISSTAIQYTTMISTVEEYVSDNLLPN